MSRVSNRFASPLAAFVVAVAVCAGGFAQSPVPAPEVRAAGERAVTVLGEVERGTVPLGDVQTILDVVFAAKRRPNGALDRVTLLRPGDDAVLVITIDVLKMIKNGDTKGNVIVNENDIVVVPDRRAAKFDIAAMLTDATLAALPDGKRAMLHAWCLEHTTDQQRLHDSIVELARLGAAGKVACKALVAKLGGPPALAGEAAVALGMLGVAAVPALPSLAQHAESADKQLAARCKAAMRAIEMAQAKAAAEAKAKGEATGEAKSEPKAK